MNKNEIVGRKSYQCDIPFRVIQIYENNGQRYALLYGEDIRLIADAPIDDLLPLDGNKTQQLLAPLRSLEEQSFQLFRQDFKVIKERQEYKSTSGYNSEYQLFHMPGKVLHVDGDPAYLKKCLTLYKEIGVPVVGVYCDEKEMPLKVPRWVEEFRPDILVITGHDAYSKHKGKKTDINAYRHSKNFVATVKKIRQKHPNLDQLIIFAGACQSHFESLINAGANFASSPLRVNIHALDPVYIVSKLSYTPFTERAHVWDLIRNTITGEKGIGGIETKGVLRMGMPYHPKNE
ncbi:sporulation peptidase YabG [Caldibacillus lycopersici]|uniref:Sporulation peptidase YabG n=1 Tax=Perspicuibacillus lycopersici TaxID=1325689 RepID=A0AAE3LPT6_9BACI|nr:sporulation peptidase YabG [Perspicuibacillus lycopersici]MCU9615296.1 sporulation peptidase YabG [Perspicuibacillus lycopersici]